MDPANDNSENHPSVKRPVSLTAGVLSYLIPGLGQVYQGRVLKGLLFWVCLWGLFFYGLYLGNWQNVYFPPSNQPNHGDIALRFRSQNQPLLVIRHAPYWAQFCIGIAAWPAAIQWASYDPAEDRHPFLGRFQRYLDLNEQAEVLRNNDKSTDLGWVYTIIAGLLNVLVIYDAFAGPAHGPHPVRMNTTLVLLVFLTIIGGIVFAVILALVFTGAVQPTMYLQLPIALVLINLVYSATRHDQWRPIVLETIHWGWRMAGFLLIIGLILYVVATMWA